jgi:hypothetical protein
MIRKRTLASMLRRISMSRKTAPNFYHAQGWTPNKLKSTVVLHIGQPVKIVVAEHRLTKLSIPLKTTTHNYGNSAMENYSKAATGDCLSVIGRPPGIDPMESLTP